MPEETYIPNDNPIVKQILGSDNVIYDIVDQGARYLIEALGSPMHYIGEVSTSDSHYSSDWDNQTYNPIVIVDGNSTKSVTAVSGDIVTKATLEYVFDGTKWHKFGDVAGLGAFAFTDTGSVTIMPKGTNAASAVTFSGGTTDVVLGESTTFKNSSSAVTHGTPTTDDVLGADTNITASSSSVTFGTPTTETFIKSTITATVPKPAAGTAKYMNLDTSNLETDTIQPISSVGTPSTTPTFSANVDNSGVLSFSWDAGTASTVPSLGTAKTFATGSISATGTGASVGTALSSKSSTATGRVMYIDSVTTSGTNAVTFASGHTADAITGLPTATAAAQTITVGTNDTVAAVTGMPESTAAAQTITVGTNDKVTAIKTLGTATAAAQKFTGTPETYTVTPVSQ